MIHVSCGLILNNQYEVLMTLRRPEQLRPNMWEMPGGKREPGETDQACLVRELREELGVDVEVDPRAIAIDWFEWKELTVCTLYRAVIKAGNPRPLDAAALAHFEMEYAMERIPMCPSSYKFYPFVMRYIEVLKQAT